MRAKLFFLMIIVTIMLSGCIGQKTEVDVAKDACVKKCSEALAAGQDLSNGPCLSNEITKNWVCDVAHSPRLTVDNDPKSQCSSYGTTAAHFIEVNPGCNFIRAV